MKYRCRTAAAAMFLAVILASHASAATPPDDLAAWVPQGWTVYLELRDARGLALAVGDAQLAARFANTRLGMRMQLEEKMRQWQAICDAVRRNNGMDLNESFREAFGAAIAVAADARPGAEGPNWLGFLAAGPGKSEPLLHMIWDGDRQKGDITDFREEPGKGYSRIYITRRNGNKQEQVIAGPVFLAAKADGAIGGAVAAATGGKPSLAGDERFAAVRRELGGGSLFGWLDVKRIGAALPADADDQKPGVALRAALRTGALDYVAMRGTLGDGRLVADVRVVFAEDRMPAPLAAMLAAKPPKESRTAALLAAADPAAHIYARLPLEDTVALIRWLAGPNAEAGIDRGVAAVRNVLGGMTLRQIGEVLGPEMALVALPSPAGADTMPACGLVVEASDEPMFRGRLLGALDMLFTAIALDAAKKSPDAPGITFSHEDRDGLRLGVIDIKRKGLPAGLRPSYAFVDGFFVFGSNPEAVAALARAAAKRPAAAPGATPVLRIDAPRTLAAVGALIDALKPPADEPGPARRGRWDRIKERFDLIRETLAPLGAVTLYSQPSPHELRLGIEVSTDWNAWPLPGEK